MKTIVITGSSRGIGYGLADAFLARDCAVVISGRSQATVERAIAELAAHYASDRVAGFSCDVTEPDQVQALWDAAIARFGQIDIWINNAGVGHAQTAAWELPVETARTVVDTNILGVVYGSQVAMHGMLAQGAGSIYIMEGAGSDGRKHKGLSLYAASKYGLRYFTEALIEEAKGTPVLVGALRPGMVLTEFITEHYEDRPEEWERFKSILNIIADRVETVTPWLVDQILANDKHGILINWLTRGKLMRRFLTARFRKRDLFDS